MRRGFQNHRLQWKKWIKTELRECEVPEDKSQDSDVDGETPSPRTDLTYYHWLHYFVKHRKACSLECAVDLTDTPICRFRKNQFKVFLKGRPKGRPPFLYKDMILLIMVFLDRPSSIFFFRTCHPFQNMLLDHSDDTRDLLSLFYLDHLGFISSSGNVTLLIQAKAFRNLAVYAVEFWNDVMDDGDTDPEQDSYRIFHVKDRKKRLDVEGLFITYQLGSKEWVGDFDVECDLSWKRRNTLVCIRGKDKVCYGILVEKRQCCDDVLECRETIHLLLATHLYELVRYAQAEFIRK